MTARLYRHRLTRQRLQMVACRTKKDRGPETVQYGLFTLRSKRRREVTVTGAELRRDYEHLQGK